MVLIMHCTYDKKAITYPFNYLHVNLSVLPSLEAKFNQNLKFEKFQRIGSIFFLISGACHWKRPTGML